MNIKSYHIILLLRKRMDIIWKIKSTIRNVIP